jgi:DNA-binding transcriptional LysR family regulator
MDMNLARVFVSIYETRSLTLAADRLYVTQSAVSQSLSRLRVELDDPLFERSGRTMEPSHLAHHVFPHFRDATLSIDLALADVRGFDPASTTRRFRIAMSELGEIGWLPKIARELATAAPGTQLEVVPLDPDTLPESLARGLVDIAITPIDLASEFERTVVKWQEYGVVMSVANTLAENELTVSDYNGCSRAVISSDSGAPILEAAERHAGITAEPAVTIQHYATLPALLLARPMLIAAIPRSIAEGWAAGWPLTVKPLPFAMSPVQIRVYRRSSTQETTALDWFYNLVARVVASTAARFDVIQGSRGSRAV